MICDTRPSASLHVPNEAGRSGDEVISPCQILPLQVREGDRACLDAETQFTGTIGLCVCPSVEEVRSKPKSNADSDNFVARFQSTSMQYFNLIG